MSYMDHDWKWMAGAGDTCKACGMTRSIARKSQLKATCPGAARDLVGGLELGPSRCRLCGTKAATGHCGTVGCPMGTAD